VRRLRRRRRMMMMTSLAVTWLCHRQVQVVGLGQGRLVVLVLAPRRAAVAVVAAVAAVVRARRSQAVEAGRARASPLRVRGCFWHEARNEF
jgi:hypothetical protein